MARFRKIYLLIAFVGLAATAFAQDTLAFTKGLALGAVNNGTRTAVYTDWLYHQLFTLQFKKPKSGDVLGKDAKGNIQEWAEVTINKKGIFESPKLRGGYLFLEYNSPRQEIKLLEVSGHAEVFVNGVPHAGDLYNKKLMVHPVELKKGANIILVKGSRGEVNLKLYSADKPVRFLENDLTSPDFMVGETGYKTGAIRVLNATNKNQQLKITAEANGKITTTALPSIIPLTLRKVGYDVAEIAATQKGKADVILKLYSGNKLLDQTTISYNVKDKDQMYTRTFRSNIDGSTQYFSVVESSNKEAKPAMFLALHGAAVEGRRHASTFKAKDWGHIIAPTNRRDYGFDWEDWGRWDALEVQQLAEKMYRTDPARTYVTGHSMGGHGTWQLGVNFPGKWAAIAPISGWSSLFSYANKKQVENPSAMEEMFVRASNSSNTLALSSNYLQQGIYVSHGDADKTVPVEQARLMREHLANFHPDFAYQEYQDKPHWFGADFPQIFDYFKWHVKKSDNDIERFTFKTASPAVSASNYFITLYQQEQPYAFSEVKVSQTVQDNSKNDAKPLQKRVIHISPSNLSKIKVSLAHCTGIDSVFVQFDKDSAIDVSALNGGEAWFCKNGQQWELCSKPGGFEKSPVRSGNFKEAFNHNMVFVYGTNGKPEENEWALNKARFDAETFYYRGNGSIDVIADKEFSPAKYKDRSVILFGNENTNTAWKKLLFNCPVQVTNGAISIGNKTLKGDSLGVYFTYPRKDSETALVGVVAGTGKQGFASVTPNRYFVSGVGIPDIMVFTPEIYQAGIDAVQAAGYFGNDWSIENSEVIWK